MALFEKSTLYRNQLQQMCRTLSCSGIVCRRAPDISARARQLLSYLQANQNRRTGFALTLNPNWKVNVVERGICGALGHTELHFGGEIVFEEECLVRQVLTVVILFCPDVDLDPIEGRPRLVAGENHVVRRFHFDFDPSAAERHTPIAHLQIGGQLNQTYLSIPEASPCRYELFDQMDCPRLPWPITGLPIVFDTFLRQFPSGLDEFVGGAAWRRCVMDSERLWLTDYFHNAAVMMRNEAARECLYDYCCTESAFF